MGILELVGLTIAQQALTATSNFCKAGAAGTTNAIGKAAYLQGQQFAANMATLAKWGLGAAGPEFTAGQAYDTTVITSEKALVAQLPTLPPIT